MTISAKEFIKQKKEEVRKPIKMKDIGRKIHRVYEKKAITFLIADNLDKKVFVFERLELTHDSSNAKKYAYAVGKKGDIEYRIGYYIVGRIGNKKGRWTWGQYTPMISKKDLDKLMKKAKKEGTYL